MEIHPFLTQDTHKENVIAPAVFIQNLAFPAFVAEAEKLKLELAPMTGEAMQSLVADLAKTPPKIVERVRNALTVP